jgi:hypothetical protein
MGRNVSYQKKMKRRRLYLKRRKGREHAARLAAKQKTKERAAPPKA